MASTGDDGSETDSVADEVFHRSSSAIAGAEEAAEVEHALDPYGDERQVLQHHRRDLNDESQSDLDIEQDENEQGYSDEDDERENRFDGPAGTWRFYTESERNLAASLDQERASNLSLHLYNAHALKVGARDAKAAAEAKHYHGQKHWMKADEDGTLPWHPDAHWTAWPLKPENVPRKSEAFGAATPSRDEERATFRKPGCWKPSLDLEEEIQAIMLRQAKEQLHGHLNIPPAQKLSLPYRAAEQSSPRKRKRSSSRSSSTAPSSHTGDEPRTARLDRRDSSVHDPDQTLDVLIDDEEAAEILQPSVRQVTSKLDDLLLGLHKSRNGHVRESTSPRSRSRYERRKSRIRARSQAGTGEGNADDASDQAIDKSSRKSRRSARSQTTSAAASKADITAVKAEKKAKRKPPLNPRDWSEVLGVASLVGWDADVVQRATERCASLFEECMTFRELGKTPEGEVEGNQEYGAHHLVVEEQDRGEGYSCPVESCSRHTEPWPLKKTWRWREHLKRSHKYSRAGIERLEAYLKTKMVGDAAPGEVGGESDAQVAGGASDGYNLNGDGAEVIER